MNQQSELIEQIELLMARVFVKGQLNGDISKEIQELRELLQINTTQLKQGILEKVIGEDESAVYGSDFTGMVNFEHKKARNEYRAVQRARINTLLPEDTKEDGE